MIKQLIKKIIGTGNIQYLKSLYKSPEEQNLMHKRLAFYTQIIGKEDTYFDVGANFGNRIEVMLQLGCQVVAVEPQKSCYQFLKRKYGSKIHMVQKAAGEREEKKEFFISDSTTISTFSKEWIEAVKASGRFSNQEWNRTEVVEVTTLDKLIQEFGLPQFIKIDVEGFELEVLKGLHTPVQYISIEYTVPEQTDRAIQCLEYLRQMCGEKLLECNYSVGESMEWANSKWMSVESMVEHIQTKEFIATGFGDIYIRHLSR